MPKIEGLISGHKGIVSHLTRRAGEDSTLERIYLNWYTEIWIR